MHAFVSELLSLTFQLTEMKIHGHTHAHTLADIVIHNNASFPAADYLIV